MGQAQLDSGPSWLLLAQFDSIVLTAISNTAAHFDSSPILTLLFVSSCCSLSVRLFQGVNNLDSAEPEIRINPIRPGGGGPQRPGWPNSQLPIRNLSLKLWLLVFIFKTNFSKIDQSGGLLLLFSHRDVPKIYKMKKFSFTWKLLKLTWGVNFGWRRTILDIKIHFLKVKPLFRGVNSRIWWLVSFFWGKFCDVISPKLEELPDSNFASGMLLWP